MQQFSGIQVSPTRINDPGDTQLQVDVHPLIELGDVRFDKRVGTQRDSVEPSSYIDHARRDASDVRDEPEYRSVIRTVHP